MTVAQHPFDAFFEENGYADGEEPQAFADWLASLSGKRQVGVSSEGAVEGHPKPVSVPGYWMNETSGVLRPAVERYLAGEDLSADELGEMRAYLRQWMLGPWGGGAPIEALRQRVDAIGSTADLRAWLTDALDHTIDPL